MMKSQTYPPFTQEEFAAEIREFLFIQAGHIAHGCNAEAATIFLGIPHEFSPTEGVKDEIVNQIDLSRFECWKFLRAAYDFAFQVGDSWHYDEDTNIDLVAFMQGMSIYAISGEYSPYLVPDSKCRHVIDLAIGRFYLEEPHAQSITVRQLALLADMSEAAVRNSLSAEKMKAPVEADAARTWLQGRKGYVPTKVEDNRRADWELTLKVSINGGRFSSGLESILKRMGLTAETAAEQAGIAPSDIAMRLDGPSGLPDLGAVKGLGELLQADVPNFVGQAVEAAMRQQK